MLIAMVAHNLLSRDFGIRIDVFGVALVQTLDKIVANIMLRLHQRLLL